MRGVGSAMGHSLADLAHDVLAPGQYRDWIAVRHGLGEGTQVGIDAIQLLHTATCNPEPGLHLVDDQHDPMLVAQETGRTQVFGIGRNAEAVAHDGLDEQARYPPGAALEDIFELVRIIRLYEVSEAPGADGNALAVG